MNLLKILLALAALPVLGRAEVVEKNPDLMGCGASFPAPLYSKWFREIPGIKFKYTASGSGKGQKAILEGKVDFGASDSPLSDESLAQARRKLLHIPMVAGAVAVVYKLEKAPKLQLDGVALSEIFDGKIGKWNDPAIQHLNPEVALPETEITVVHRADGSGTSAIFTSYLKAMDPSWAAGTLIEWPFGVGQKGNSGVADQVGQFEGSIGYVELGYALEKKLPIAAIRNRAGVFVTPTIDSIEKALASAVIPKDLRFSMVNPPGADAYPICGATWLLVDLDQTDHDKKVALQTFLRWALTDGQKEAAALYYAPLPEELRERALTEVDSITGP